ncbi:hypothetical protein L1987_65964 [Smallanthus sonchifolius]|uniref:Uncharacterized protein n=1 Tax=Smallanthus sonchifolius TaxID=185202 RepID=A0ACB9BVS7_9ASTR|nr:hypothetical protein L1987_65964 [Smallanthus sonchifolius]
MTREIRVSKYEPARPVMKHIDSPRPFVHQKSIQRDRKDRNTVKEVKEISRFSCDERESQYSLKSTIKVKEPPRLSLDSKQNSNLNSKNESRSKPGSIKRPSSGVVARLMGLDSLTDSICEVETLKINPAFSDQMVSRSPMVHSKTKPALQQQDGGDRVFRKPSVYGEMEKMLTALEFNTSGKDLRALKQILEAIQMTKTGLKNKEQSLDLQKPNQPLSPTVKGTSSPKRRELVNRAMKQAKMATESKIITKHHDVNHTDRKQPCLNNENLQDDQTEWNQVGINTDADVRLENRYLPVQQTELLNSIDETLASPCESINVDHGYIKKILLASGFLKDVDSAIRIVQLHPTSSVIKPELFQLLENPNVKEDPRSKSEKVRRKMIFDYVNEILFNKLANRNGKISGRFMNGEKLLKELWSEIDVLQDCSRRCIYDEDDDDDEVKNIVGADVNKKSEDWDKCSYEVPGVVLDIERLVFKDLIDEVVNVEVASLQDRPRIRCRQLFSL